MKFVLLQVQTRFGVIMLCVEDYLIGRCKNKINNLQMDFCSKIQLAHQVKQKTT